MARKVVVGQDEVELVALRSRNCKTFRKPDGSFRAIARAAPLHWDDQGSWVEVDHTPVTQDGRVFSTASTPYVLSWDAQTCTLTYSSKRGGDVRVRLAALDGVPVSGPFPAATVVGQSVKVLVAPQLQIELRIRTHGVELYKILLGPLAPKSLTWEVTEGGRANINFDPMTTTGRDNMSRTNRSRPDADILVRRGIEMTHQKSATVVVDGKNVYTVTETFTGKTRFIDPQTRARSWIDEAEYPIEIDVSITENIGANDDDGYGQNFPYWVSGSGITTKSGKNGAFRFQTVNVPNAATINSAVLTIRVTGSSGSQTSTMAGENVDSAPAWANHTANAPQNMAATTATTTVNVLAAGLRTIDVKTACQEIVNRAGWVANNHMRFGWTVTTGMTSSYMYIEEYEAAGTDEAQLDIDYTAGGASYTITAAQGSYSLSGQAVALKYGRRAAAAQGSYVLSGQAVALRIARLLGIAQGSYTLAGQAVALKHGYVLAAAQGAYALAGQNVTLTYSTARTLLVGQGSYTLTGRAVSLLWAHRLVAAQGSYTLTGQATVLRHGFTLVCGSGSYSLAGQAVALKYGRRLVTVQGSYLLSGKAVTLVYSGAGIIPVFGDPQFVTVADNGALRIGMHAPPAPGSRVGATLPTEPDSRVGAASPTEPGSRIGSPSPTVDRRIGGRIA